MPADIEKLIADVSGNDPDARFRACRELEALGPAAKEAVRPLVKSLYHPHTYYDKSNPQQWEQLELTRVAFRALCKIDKLATLRELASRICSSNLLWLSELPGCEAQLKPIFLNALKSPEAEIRRAGVLALTNAGYKEVGVARALMKCLTEKDPFYKIHVIEGLGKIGPKALCAVSALTKLLKSEEFYEERLWLNETEYTYVRNKVREALEKISPLTIEKYSI